MSDPGSDATAASKSYAECAVQTELASQRQSPIPPASPSGHLDMSFDNLANGSLLFSDFGSPSADAYTHSSPRPADAQPPQRLAKPRLEPSRPSSTNIESNRIVSMPETAPVFQIKRELNTTTRIVSMPSRPGEAAIADLSMSSEDTSGNTSSMYTASSLASVDESDVSVDSVIIIEHNHGLAEGFLRPETIKEEVEDQEATKPGCEQEDWSSWTRSPPRPIPALHGPLSLPYARCPSGAEGTIIDEPESIPRMIWGLDTESQHSKPQSPAVQSQSLSPPVRSAPSPAMFKQAVATPVKISQPLPPPPPSATAERDFYSGRVKEVASPAKPPAAFQPTPHPTPKSAVLENQFDFKRVSPSVFHHQDGPHSPQDVRDVYRAQIQPNIPASAHTDLPRVTKAHDFPMSTTAGAMKVTARSAPGSALPQIVIEPRSPESMPTAYHQPTAIELAHKYQRQVEQQALRNINPLSYLPTPPNSSSPLWSSGFSPYPETVPSPLLSDTQVLAQAIQRQQSQLRALEESEHLRRMVQERLSNINSSYGALEPAAHIDSLYTSRPTPQIDYSQLSSREDLIAFLARNERLAGADALAAAQPTVHASRPRTFSDHAKSPTMSTTAREVSASPSSLTNSSYGLATPTSPEVTHVPRGSITHQPRSIPLARLMQRRLSAVPEESDSSTTSPAAVHGLGLDSDKRQWARRSDRAHGSRIFALDYVDKASRTVEIERAPRGPDERSPRGFEGGRASRGHNTNAERASRGFDSGERQTSGIDGGGGERVKIRLPASQDVTDTKGKLMRAPAGPRAPATSGTRSQPAQATPAGSRIVDDRENDAEPPSNAPRRRMAREPARDSGAGAREAGAAGHGRSQRKPAAVGAGRG